MAVKPTLMSTEDAVAPEQRRESCCAGSVGSFDDRLSLGARRREQLRGVALVASAGLCAASAGLMAPSPWRRPILARRLAWSSAACGLPLVLRDVRDAPNDRASSRRLLGHVCIAAVGLAGLPLVPATATVASRAVDLGAAVKRRRGEVARSEMTESCMQPTEPPADKDSETCRRSCS